MLTTPAVPVQPHATTTDGCEPARHAKPTTAAAAERIASRFISERPRPAPFELGEVDHPLADGRYQTPLRYPGAKSGLAPLVAKLIAGAESHRSIRGVDLLVEPFAGGASTSLRLVGSGTVERILLADADPTVAAFWQVAASQTAELTARMRQEHADYVKPGGPAALARWDYWRQWAPAAGTSASTARFERAMRCLFLNRTTFSGILHGRAGPIGGRAQTSAYTIGCRYNPDALADRLEFIGHLYESGRLADVWCMDWRDTMNQVASTYKTLVPDHVLAYLDPPYLDKSAQLYTTSFAGARRTASHDWTDSVPHELLAAYLTQQIRYRWVLSYDYQPELLASFLLYGRDRMTPDNTTRRDGVRQWRISKRLVQLNYTASARNGRGPTDELLIATLPPNTVPTDDRFRAVPS